MAYRIPAANFPANAMPGEPLGSPHSVSTGVRKAIVPKVKGHVTYGVKRPPKVASAKPPRPAKPKPTPQPSVDPNQALIDAAVRLKYGGQEQGLNTQLGQNASYAAGLPGWYASALNEIRSLQQQGQAQSAQTLQGIQNYVATPTVDNSLREQQAAASRESLNNQFANQFGRDASANSAFMDRLAAANAIGQTNAQLGAGQQRQGILGQQTALKGQEGDYRTTYGAGLQSAANKAASDAAKLNLAAKALGIKSETLHTVQQPLAKSLQTNRTAGQRVARTNARTQRMNANERATKDQVDAAYRKNKLLLDTYKAQHPGSTRKGGASGGYSAAKLQGFRDSYTNAIATAQQAKKNAKGGTTVDELYTALLGHYDAPVAKAAAQAAFGQAVDKQTRHQLALRGLHPKAQKNLLSQALGALGIGQ